MNGCNELQFNLISGTLGSTESNACQFILNNGRFVTNEFYLNINKIVINKDISGNSNIRLCQYDKNYNVVFNQTISLNDGENVIDVNPNYYTKFSVGSHYNQSNLLKVYQCNVGIGSMSNELAFGSTSFLESISTLIPFVIILIGFGLGFTLLKRLIKKGSGGQPV